MNTEKDSEKLAAGTKRSLPAFILRFFGLAPISQVVARDEILNLAQKELGKSQLLEALNRGLILDAIGILDGEKPLIDWRDPHEPELLRKLCEQIEAHRPKPFYQNDLQKEDVILALIEVGLGAKLVNEILAKLGFPLAPFPAQNVLQHKPESKSHE